MPDILVFNPRRHHAPLRFPLPTSPAVDRHHHLLILPECPAYSDAELLAFDPYVKLVSTDEDDTEPYSAALRFAPDCGGDSSTIKFPLRDVVAMRAAAFLLEETLQLYEVNIDAAEGTAKRSRRRGA
ncbi:hypothetical protein quinque_006481 [Culex quinquefasciatus]